LGEMSEAASMSAKKGTASVLRSPRPQCVKTHIVLGVLALRLHRRISGNLDEVYSRENVMSKHRSELQNEVARALIESKAVDLEVVGKVLGQFGARAAMSGETIGAIIGRRCWDICIPPEPYGVNVAEIAGAANR
jgi:hypothetical protein